MAIPTRLTDFSTTAASNFPAGSESIFPNLDDYLRAYQSVVRGDLAFKGADIASASTTDLGAVQGSSHTITGTTGITSFGTVSAGIWKFLTFSGILTLTHNGTSLILPGAANITTAAGDTCRAESLGSGNWRVHWYFAKAGGVIGTTQSISHLGDITISKATPILAIDGTGTTSSFLRLTRGGVTKWDVVNAGTTSDQFQITDGAVILVTVNRTTGNSVFTGSVTATGGLVANFTSAETALGGASTTTVAHGLGAVPSHFEIVIRNKITELGYAVGDEVSMASNISAGVLTLWADAINVGMTQTASSITICRRDTFVGAAITVANWKYVVRAWK